MKNLKYAAVYMAISFTALTFHVGEAQSQEGCYYADVPVGGVIDPKYPLQPPVEIDVYTTDNFYTSPIGAPPFSSAEREQMVRALLAKFRWETGILTHYVWKGNISHPELGRKVNISDCDLTPYSFNKPTLILNADNTTCGPNAIACSWAEKYGIAYGPDKLNCARITFSKNKQSHVNSAHMFRKVFLHELMHTWKMPHQNDDIDCDRNRNDVCIICDASLSADASFLTRADRWYMRNDLGLSPVKVIEGAGAGFPPSSWSMFFPTLTLAISGARATDGVDDMSGFVYNIDDNGQPEARILLYEGASWTEHDVTNFDSYYLPDVTRTVGLGTEKWFSAYFVNDSKTSQKKAIFYAEKSVGGTWSTGTLSSNHHLPYIATAYDPVSGKFIIATERDGGFRFYTRDSGNPSQGWVYTQFLIESFDGADIACSQYNSLPATEMNCIIVYAPPEANSTIKFRRMKVNSSGGVLLSAEYNSGYFAYTRPTVTVNPNNSDPQFLFSFNQGGVWTYIRKMDRGSTAWSSSGVTSYQASSKSWMGPGSLGTWKSGSTVYTDVMANDD